MLLQNLEVEAISRKNVAHLGSFFEMFYNAHCLEAFIFSRTPWLDCCTNPLEGWKSLQGPMGIFF